MPGSPTTPCYPSACVGALGNIAFRYTDSVGTRNQFSIAAQWLACTFPCRRFADILTAACARLGADVVRYSFIVVDLHHLLLAGLPAYLCECAHKWRQNQRRGGQPSISVAEYGGVKTPRSLGGKRSTASCAKNIAHIRALLAVPLLPIDAIKAANPKASTSAQPEKPFACLLAPQPATAQLVPTLRSPRNSRSDLQRHTGPQIRKRLAPEL